VALDRVKRPVVIKVVTKELRIRDHSEALGVDGRILKLIFKK
jgi:hypothetical protein